MKNHIRHFAYLINLCILIICFTACQEDDVILAPETNSVLEETQKTTTINYEEIQNDNLFQDLITKRGLKGYFDISSELSNSKNNNELGFIIKSTEAVKIIKDGYTSYTLSVRRKKESLYDIDNLVIGQKDGETKTQLYTYHFTQESFHGYIGGEPFTEDLKYTIRELSNEGTVLSSSEGTISLKKDTTVHKGITVKSSGCTTVFISVPRYCHCVTPPHGPWDGCSCTPRSGWDTTSIRVCGNSGDGPLTTGYTFDNQRISAGRGSGIPDFTPLDPGDGGMTTTIFATAEEFTLDNLHQRVRFSSAQLNWFLEGTNVNYAPLFASFNYENNWSQESKNLTKEMTNLLATGNTKQKNLVKAVLEKDIDRATNIILQGAEFTQVQCCDNDQTPRIMAEITAKLAIDFLDAGFNIFIIGLEIFRTDEREGRFVRTIMKETGIDVPSEIDDATLGSLFKVRKRNRELVTEPFGEWYTPILDLGFTVLDLMAVISPSTNGGAFLAIKGGGTITGKALSDYLKVLAKGKWKTVNESMSDAAKSYQEFISGKNWNESFEMILPNGNPVKFDALKDGVLGEAKSGMLNFVDANGNFKPFFTGQDAIVNQARRQREAASDLPIEWHFEHDIVRQAFQNLLQNRGFNIKFIHTPR
ncbi:Tox-REase-5 domain-containing protein [Aquimarina sp. RZ0]|uniref:Tox-REase-5 domain-containing protein n=1 Tax=Aquimarina sp. RZ0 TaxID=2607730 RepID=UPI0011F23F22|nr:Tox-REase-5 domain-containing protein [Aquimarina sp. RZ0]KAA1245780.1 hypothetical protein F0000_10280 [Aquimarina sp. RZ0]